ncbi:MAG: hypothetical protein ACRC1M_04995, partial [Methanobacteriaceae archaeon]
LRSDFMENRTMRLLLIIIGLIICLAIITPFLLAGFLVGLFTFNLGFLSSVIATFGYLGWILGSIAVLVFIILFIVLIILLIKELRDFNF